MSMLDGLLGEMGQNATVQNLAAKVGLTPEQIEMAIAALGQAHVAPGDTVATAADQSGLPHDKLQEVLAHLGGEGSLGRLAGMMGEGGSGGLGGMLGGLLGR
jgi:hypothetical protein